MDSLSRLTDVIFPCLNDYQIASLVAEASDVEIKDTLFSLCDDKAPGPDGYTACFFKMAWNIVGKDFTAAIKYFFSTSELVGGLNATAITLVPKIPNPSSMSDYRPISYYNTTYKVISKVLTNRLKTVIHRTICSSHAAFISGRSISDQIFLMQELVMHYHKTNISLELP